MKIVKKDFEITIHASDDDFSQCDPDRCRFYTESDINGAECILFLQRPLQSIENPDYNPDYENSRFLHVKRCSECRSAFAINVKLSRDEFEGK